jgi:hypothetical protein
MADYIDPYDNTYVPSESDSSTITVYDHNDSTYNSYSRDDVSNSGDYDE